MNNKEKIQNVNPAEAVLASGFFTLQNSWWDFRRSLEFKADLPPELALKLLPLFDAYTRGKMWRMMVEVYCPMFQRVGIAASLINRTGWSDAKSKLIDEQLYLIEIRSLKPKHPEIISFDVTKDLQHLRRLLIHPPRLPTRSHHHYFSGIEFSMNNRTISKIQSRVLLQDAGNSLFSQEREIISDGDGIRETITEVLKAGGRRKGEVRDPQEISRDIHYLIGLVRGVCNPVSSAA